MKAQKLADFYSRVGESELNVILYGDGSILYSQKSRKTTSEIRELLKSCLVEEGTSSDGLTTCFILNAIPQALDSINERFGGLTYADKTDSDWDRVEIAVNELLKCAEITENRREPTRFRVAKPEEPTGAGEMRQLRCEGIHITAKELIEANKESKRLGFGRLLETPKASQVPDHWKFPISMAFAHTADSGVENIRLVIFVASRRDGSDGENVVCDVTPDVWAAINNRKTLPDILDGGHRSGPIEPKEGEDQ